LIVSGFRAESGLGTFTMFDFTPVGIAMTLAGLLFVVSVGWRLVPGRDRADSASFDTAAYTTEARLEEGSKAVGISLGEAEKLLDEADAQIIGMVRHEFRVMAPNPHRILEAGDILIIEADPDALAKALANLGVALAESKEANAVEEEAGDGHAADDSPSPLDDTGTEAKPARGAAELVVQELVVAPASALANRSATDIQLRTRYGINLLALSREGRRSIRRLRTTLLQPGDVLLVQGAEEAIAGFVADYGCLPLATRDIRIPVKGQALHAGLIMVAAIAASATGLAPAAVAFAAAALAYLLLRIVPPRAVHLAVDWPVIVLLGAMLPV